MSEELEYYRNPDQDGSVFAVDPSSRELRDDDLIEGYASTFERSNSPVDWVPIDQDQLGEKLTETEARDIHPRLFERFEREIS